MIELRNKILNWLKTTQKATAGALGAATAVASATFIPQPYNGYAAFAVVVLTWLVAYGLPFVQTAVEAFPEDVVQPSESPAEAVTTEIPVQVLDPVSGELHELSSTAAYIDTAGIPVVEGADTGERSHPGPTVEDILTRLRQEASA